MEQLAISVLGERHPSLMRDITAIITTCECTIVDCRLFTFGLEYSINLLIGGNWNALAKVESQLPGLENKYSLHILMQRTKSNEATPDDIPYEVYLIAAEDAKVAHELGEFLFSLGIAIEECECEGYLPRGSSKRMQSVSARIHLPTGSVISELREKFMVFCDRFNFDGVLEPDKG